jgi:hypothetical protein
VFLGDPKSQVLTDPQSLNSYSYANDNPIVKSDPSGKCIEDGCVGEVTALTLAVRYGPAVIGAVGSGAGAIIGNNLQNRQTSPAELTTAVGVGAFSGEYLGARRALASGAAFVGSLAQDYVAGRSLDYGNAGTAAGTAFVTGEFFKFGAGVSPLERVVQRGASQISLSSAINQVRYQTALGVFQMATGAVAQNYYQNAQSTPSTVPSSIKQGGIMYVRNSSGLLNFAPTK